MYGTFIKALVLQAILLFGSDMQLMTTGLEQTLRGLNNMVALRMTKQSLVGDTIAVGSTPHLGGYG